MEKLKPDVSLENVTEVLKLLSAHDAEITTLSKTTESLKADINGISNKIDAFHNELTRLLSRPVHSFTTSLSIAKDAGILIGLVVSCIVYVASAALEARMVLLEERQKTSVEHVKEDILRLEGKKP